MKKLLATILILLSILFSFPCFAEIEISDKGIEDEKYQISLLENVFFLSKAQAKDSYNILKAVGMVPLTHIDFDSVTNYTIDGNQVLVKNFKIYTKDFFGILSLNDKIITKVSLGNSVDLYYNLMSKGGGIKNNAYAIGIPQGEARQYKEALDKALTSFYNDPKSGHTNVLSMKINPTEWTVLKKDLFIPDGVPKDVVAISGKFEVVYFDQYRGKKAQFKGCNYHAYIDRNYNVYGLFERWNGKHSYIE